MPRHSIHRSFTAVSEPCRGSLPEHHPHSISIILAATLAVIPRAAKQSASDVHATLALPHRQPWSRLNLKHRIGGCERPSPILFLTSLSLSGCTSSPRSQDIVRRTTAAVTRTVANDVKGAALGVRDGLRHDPNNDPVDINTSSEKTLEALPGVTPAMAAKVVANRPLPSPVRLTPPPYLAESNLRQGRLPPRRSLAPRPNLPKNRLSGSHARLALRKSDHD